MSFISLMQDIWTTLQVWFLVIEGPLLGFFFFFKSRRGDILKQGFSV